jgi:hypothetical protein
VRISRVTTRPRCVSSVTREFRNWGSIAVTNPGTNVAAGTSTYMAQGPLGQFTANGSWDWDAALWDLGAAPSGPP